MWYLIVPIALFLSSCGYRFSQDAHSGEVTTLSIPYIKGDSEGFLNQALVEALSSSGVFECVQHGGEWTIEVNILADSDDRIGYRFDRNPTSGKLRKNIIGTENRHTILAEVKVIDAHTQKIVIGPQMIKGNADYDYVDSNSIRDLTFFNPGGRPETVIDFSLGQLDSIEGAHDDSAIVAYQEIARKVVLGLLSHKACSTSLQ